MFPNKAMSLEEFTNLPVAVRTYPDSTQYIKHIVLNKHTSDAATTVPDKGSIILMLYKGVTYVTFGSPLITDNTIKDDTYYGYWWYPYKTYPQRRSKV